MSQSPCELGRICESLERSLGVSEEVASRLAVSGYCSVADLLQSDYETLERVTGLAREAVEDFLSAARDRMS